MDEPGAAMLIGAGALRVLGNAKSPFMGLESSAFVVARHLRTVCKLERNIRECLPGVETSALIYPPQACIPFPRKPTFANCRLGPHVRAVARKRFAVMQLRIVVLDATCEAYIAHMHLTLGDESATASLASIQPARVLRMRQALMRLRHVLRWSRRSRTSISWMRSTQTCLEKGTIDP